MSPFLAYHATARRHRESIRRYGLIPCTPPAQSRHGVYVFNDDYNHPTFSRGRFAVRWGVGGFEDCWQVAYVGPMAEDEYVENGMRLLDSVPPQCLSLITHLTDHLRI